MGDKFVLEVLNPRNAMKIEEPSGLAPRVTTLDGIRIAIISEKPDGSLYLVRLKELLAKRHPGFRYVRKLRLYPLVRAKRSAQRKRLCASGVFHACFPLWKAVSGPCIHVP